MLTREEQKVHRLTATRRWRMRNKERNREFNHKYKAARRAKGLDTWKDPDYMKKWLDKNKAHVRAWHKLYREKIKANPDALERKRKSGRAWNQRNVSHRKIIAHNRRARITGAGGKLSKDVIEMLLIAQRGECVFCHAHLRRVGYHLDHIDPIALGGANSDSNVQLLCPSCNYSKGSKNPIDYLLERGILDDILPA